MPTIFPRYCKHDCNELHIYHGYILYKSEIIFTQILHFQHTLPTFALYSLCRQRKTTEGSELFMHAVFQFIAVRKRASSESILQTAKGKEVGGC